MVDYYDSDAKQRLQIKIDTLIFKSSCTAAVINNIRADNKHCQRNQLLCIQRPSARGHDRS